MMLYKEGIRQVEGKQNKWYEGSRKKYTLGPASVSFFLGVEKRLWICPALIGGRRNPTITAFTGLKMLQLTP